jgi:F-type H+-transporting ATPase subunit b
MRFGRRAAALHSFRSFRVPALVAFVSLALVGVAQAAGGPKSDEEVLKETVYQGVNLLLLLGVIFYVVRKPTREFFAARRDRITGELDQAADLLTRAEQRNSELQRRLVDLSSEVEGIRENAARRAEGEAERILADARAAADRIRRDAQAAVDQELRRAQTELRAEAADLALELAARKLRDQIGEPDRERLVDEFITRVEAAPQGQTEGYSGADGSFGADGSEGANR